MTKLAVSGEYPQKDQPNQSRRLGILSALSFFRSLTKQFGELMELQFLERLREALRYAWVVFVILGVSLVSVVWVAQGATYNFYFNNTEQGNNSTATPQVTVSDGKVTKSPGAEEAKAPATAPTPVATDAPAATPIAAPSPLPAIEPAASAASGSSAALGNSSTATVADIAAESRPRERKYFRFTGSYLIMGEQAERSYYSPGYSSSYYSNYNYTYTRSMGGGAIGIAFFPTRGLGLNLWGGSYDAGRSSLGRGFAGADLELLPLRVSLGKWENAIEGGILLGASTLRAAHGNVATAHAGARIAFNLGDTFSVTAAGRANLGYLMGEAGIAVHL